MNLHEFPTSFDDRLAMSDLLEQIAARRDEIDTGKHVPRDLVGAMKRAGIYRASTPKMFGGDALPPADFLRMIEAIGTVDGSTAWVAAFGSANTYLAALPVETQRLIYRDGPDQVFAGGLYPLQPATRVDDGGWRVSGRWRFASGCMGADWIGVGISSMVKDREGPITLMAVAPANEVEIIENWDVVGMQGTGSHDTTVTDKYYADAWTCERGASSTIDEPLFRYPALGYQAQVHAACNIGLARAALDLVTAMAGGAKIMPGAVRLGDRGYYRTAIAQGEADWRSARSFFYEMADQVWEVVLAGDEPTIEQKNLLRLSATHAAQSCARVVQGAYRAAGMSAIHKTHRLQQMVRDTMVVTQHASLSEATLEDAGGILANMGGKPGYP